MSHQSSIADIVGRVVAEVIEPNASAVDKSGRFPREGLEALGKAGILGLLSAKELGGMGGSLRDAAETIELVGRACGSSGMVLCMHFCGAAIIERYGPHDVRRAIAEGRHVTTLALSEVGSRSHFWAPISTARVDEQNPDLVRLDAHKSWATSASEADSYVWSSRPLAAEGMSSLWLVPGQASGLDFSLGFDGLGLRGNSSGPIKAKNVAVSRSALLGPDGGGFEIMISTVLNYFQLLSSSCYLGICEAVTQKAAQHVKQTNFAHLGQSLGDLPTIRAYLARMRIKVDMLRGLLRDALTSVLEGRQEAQLRVLEVKAAAGETATEVTDLAMRVCGGAAFRKELGIERHFRDARAATVMSPTTDLLYDFIGKSMIDMPLFEA